MSGPQTPKLDALSEVVANERIAPGTYALDLHCPDLAPRLGAGQFVELRVTPGWDPFLRRPFSIADHLFGGGESEGGEPTGIRLLYIVVGRGTELMAGYKPGERVALLGPLGKRFFLDRIPERAVFVAGGIGMAPFPLLARVLREKGCRETEMIFGARDANGIYYVEEMESLGITVRPVTEDGSLGRKGLVTDEMRDRLPEWDPDSTIIYSCGPNPMFRAMGPILAETTIPCQMALEREMACGFGVCNGCVVRVHGPDGPAWEKVCVDGAVFDASRLILEEL